MPIPPLFLARVPEVRGPAPAGLGGNAPLQVEGTPCDLDNPAHRRAHQNTAIAFRQINRAVNFPRRGTVPTGELWKPGTPNTIDVEDNETGVLIVVNMDPEPGRDPNLRDGDTVAYYYEGDTAWTWKSYHDDPVRTLKFWVGEYGDIRAGWKRADGTDNSVANGGTGLDYVTPGFIVCANTAGTEVAATDHSTQPAHNHEPISVQLNTAPLFTGFADVGIMPHEIHHHEMVTNANSPSTGSQPVRSDTTFHTSGPKDAVHADLVLEHFSGEKSDIDGVPVFAGGNTTINVDDDIFASPIQAGDLIVFDDGTSVAIDSVTDDNTVVVVGDYSGQTGSLWVANSSGHLHSIAKHAHAVAITASGLHSHTGGTPAYMTAIPIERIP